MKFTVFFGRQLTAFLNFNYLFFFLYLKVPKQGQGQKFYIQENMRQEQKKWFEGSREGRGTK